MNKRTVQMGVVAALGEFKGDESAPLVPSDSMAFSDTTSDTRAEIDDDDVPF